MGVFGPFRPLGDDGRGVMAKQVGEVPMPEVQDAVPVLVRHEGPRGLGDARRERLEEPQGVAAAVHHMAQGPGLQLGGAGVAPRVFPAQIGEEAAVIAVFHWCGCTIG